MNEQNKKLVVGHIENRPDGSRVFVITEDNRNKGIHSFDDVKEVKKVKSKKISIEEFKPDFLK